MLLPKNKPYKSKANYKKYGKRHPVCENCRNQRAWLGPHHIIFRSQGGGDEDENLISLCQSCHYEAHSYSPKFWRDKFKEIKKNEI